MNTRKRPPMPPSKDWPARFHLTADLVALTIADGVLQVAVVQRDSKMSCIDEKRNGDVREIERDFKHHWALPGGHVHFDQEDVDEAAARELFEETGIKLDKSSLVQIGTYGNMGRDPRPGRTVSVAYLAFRPMFSNPVAGSDAKQANFMPVLELLTEPKRLEFDHEAMLIDAIQRVRDLVLTTSIATSFCPPEFTMSELREVYEVLWHHAYDKEISTKDRQKFAAKISENIKNQTPSSSSIATTLRNQSIAVRNSETPSLSSGALYDRLTRDMPGIEYKFSNMSPQSLMKISQIVFSEIKSSSPSKPKEDDPDEDKRLDPANFSRKVLKIPRFIEAIPDRRSRSELASTGRPAQRYRRGDAERLEPPLRLKVKRNSARDNA